MGAGSIYPPENLPEGTRQFRKIYRDELIRRLAAAGHRQKDIAQAVGLSKGHVSEIVNKKSSGIEHEPTIKSTSAAEELEAKRNIRDVDDVSHTEVAKMAAVSHPFIMKVRVSIVDSLLGECNGYTPPTIPPKSKQTSGDEAEKRRS